MTYLRVLLLALTFSLVGCWSIVNVAGHAKQGEAPMLYGGVRLWYECITHHDTGAVVGVYTLPDVPLSFTVDTALLPITLVLNLVERYVEGPDK